MQDRAEIERFIRSTYAARVAGHLDEMMRHFSDAAHFSLAGSATASPVPAAATGSAAIREVLRRLTETFEFLESKILDLVVDPETGRVAVRSRVRIRSPKTGQETETELFDLIEFEDGRIKSFRQFADTALAARLLGA